jgi:hypothetical protein
MNVQHPPLALTALGAKGSSVELTAPQTEGTRGSYVFSENSINLAVQVKACVSQSRDRQHRLKREKWTDEALAWETGMMGRLSWSLRRPQCSWSRRSFISVTPIHGTMQKSDGRS